MEDLKKELVRVGLDKNDTTESVLQELALEWNDMSQEQKDHFIELFTQADLNKPII